MSSEHLDDPLSAKHERGPDDMPAEIEAADLDRPMIDRPHSSVPNLSRRPGPEHSPTTGPSRVDESGEEIPLAGYAALVGAYLAAAAGTAMAIARARPSIRAQFSATDLLLAGIATHKLGRLITKDWVTAPLRAPFTTHVRNEGRGEVTEKPRGRGLRRAIGALLTCPWCIAPWIALPAIVGLALRPVAARWVFGLLTTVAISDSLQIGYDALKKSPSE